MIVSRLDWDACVGATDGNVLQKGAISGIQGVSTDSRSVDTGEAFVALSGERFDGHRFVRVALEAGASGIVIEKGRWGSLELPDHNDYWVVEVDDSLKALGDLARTVRRMWGGTVVGITGSAGKTTSKELLGATLSAKAPVHLTPGNWNNRIGVPLTLFQLGDEEIAIIEMGTNEPGEIAELARIAEPNVGWITNVGAAHLEGLGSLEGVASEKGAMFHGVSEGGAIVVNLDDARVAEQASHVDFRRLTYGTRSGADIQLQSVSVPAAGELNIALSYAGETSEVRLAGIGEHMGLNLAGALASALSVGVTWEDALAGAAKFTAPSKRMNLRLVAGIHVLDDCYNANPTSTRAALQAFTDLGEAGKRFAVLGDMLELGEDSELFHRELGQETAELNLDGLISVGMYGVEMAEGASKGGATFPVWPVANAHDAYDVLKAHVSPGDWVLVKGSRGVRLETVIEGLEKGGR